MIRLVKIELNNFGPFVGAHSVSLPENGVVLLKAEVVETGEGSGGGKSFLINSIPYVLGGCPWPSTKVQSWYTDEIPEVKLTFINGEEEFTISRGKKLEIRRPGQKPIFGKAAEEELTKIFGVDKDMRQLLTYRKQKTSGMFLGMGDTEKKAFLTKLLELEEIEKKHKEYTENAAKTQILVTEWERILSAQKCEIDNLQQKLKEAKLFSPTISSTDIVVIKKLMADIKEDEKKAAKVFSEQMAGFTKTIADETANIKAEPIDKSFLHDLRQKEKVALEEKAQLTKERQKKLHQLQLWEASLAEAKRLNDKNKENQQKLAILEKEACFTCNQTWVGETAQESIVKIKQSIANNNQIIDKAKEIFNDYKALKAELAVEPTFDKLEAIQALMADTVHQLHEAEKAAIDKVYAQKALIKQKYSEQMVSITEEYNKLKSEIMAEMYEQNAILLKYDYEQNLLQQSQRAQEAIKIDLNKLTLAYEKLQADLEALKIELNLYKDAAVLTGKEGFLGSIFEEVLNDTAQGANELFSQIANIRHVSVNFETEYETKKGDINKSIVPVFNIGGNIAKYGDPGLSGGMESAVELPIDIALSRVIMNRTKANLGWLILDEPFNGLGEISKEAALEMLSILAQDFLIIVVDHSNNFQNIFNKTITIKQKSGHSTISTVE